MWYLKATAIEYEFDTHYLEHFVIFETKEKLDEFLKDNLENLKKALYYDAPMEYKIGEYKFEDVLGSCKVENIRDFIKDMLED